MILLYPFSLICTYTNNMGWKENTFFPTEGNKDNLPGPWEPELTLTKINRLLASIMKVYRSHHVVLHLDLSKLNEDGSRPRGGGGENTARRLALIHQLVRSSRRGAPVNWLDLACGFPCGTQYGAKPHPGQPALRSCLRPPIPASMLSFPHFQRWLLLPLLH